MSLNEAGRTGVQVNLTADGVFGVVTQDPESMLSSPGGLTGVNGGSAFGMPILLLAYASHSTTYAAQTTTVTFTSDGMPYKLRVLGVKVRCLANSPKDFKDGYGYVRASVEDGDGSGVWTSILEVESMGDMETGDVREIAVIENSNAVVDTNEGLRVKVTSQADSFGINPTASFVVELQCLRVF